MRASPAFSQALTLGGRPYVAKDVEPYVQYWLTERERELLAVFSQRQGRTLDDAIDACTRLRGDASPAERRRLQRAAQGMRAAGVLIATADDTSRYDRTMLRHYLRHRPFPPELVQHIIERADVGPNTRALDLAGGPGDLALSLAARSAQVTLMELSRGFVVAARSRARQAGRPLRALHESCNRLVHDGGTYELVAVAQALHWLDDVAVCKGVCRVLAPQGHFMVVHSAFEVAASHPLAHVLGHDSVLGRKAPVAFADEVQALHDRIALLLQALDAGSVERADLLHLGRVGGVAGHRLAPQGITLFEQRRPMGLGFARALLTDAHLQAAGLEPGAFWQDAQARCAASSSAQREGTHRWALLHFARHEAPAGDGRHADARAQQERPIGCSAPDE